MPGGVIGYDRDRLSMLRARTIGAIESLRSLWSDDPAAGDAVLATRITREHLEQTWLPLIDRILASQAMVTWRGADPGAAIALLSGLSGGELGEAMADLARRILDDGDTDDMAALGVWLVLTSGDDETLRAFFTNLGGKGTAQLFLETGVGGPVLGVHPEEGRLLGTLLRDRLGAVTRSGGLPDEFGGDLVDGTIAGYEEVGRYNVPATLSFVLDDVEHGSSFLVAVTRAVVDHERGFDGAPAPLIWGLDFSDPIVPLMTAVAHSRDAGREIFTDPTLAGYLLRWEQVERGPIVQAMTSALDGHPLLVLELLKTEALEAIVVDGVLGDDELTAKVIEAGLGTSVLLAPAKLEDGGAVLARVVSVARDHTLVEGAKNGLAVAVAPYLPFVPSDVRRGEGVVELTVGPVDNRVQYDDLKRLFGQIAGHEKGQVLLTTTLSEFGNAQVDLELSKADAAPEKPADYQGPLWDFAATIKLTLDGVADANEQLAIAHASRIDDINIGLALLSPVSFSSGLGAKALSAGSRIFGAITASGQPQQIDTSKLRKNVQSTVKIRLIEGILDSPALSAQFGLDPRSTEEQNAVREVRELIEEFYLESVRSADVIESHIGETLYGAEMNGRVDELWQDVWPAFHD